MGIRSFVSDGTILFGHLKTNPLLEQTKVFILIKKSVVILIGICNIIHWPLLSVALPKLFSNELNFHYCKNVIVREAISFEKKKGMYIRSESKSKRIDFKTFDIDRSTNIYFNLVLVTKYIDV